MSTEISQSRDYPSIPPAPAQNEKIAETASIVGYDISSSCPREASDDDLARLRHVADAIPKVVWLVAFTGAAQRLAYYGTTVPWQNYLQNPPGHPLSPGALGLGQSTATIINNAFLFLGYLSPLPFAIISDSWLGRYKTLLLSLIIFLVGQVVLFVTSLPFAVSDKETALAGFIVAMIFMGLGQGGTTAVVFPFICDQIPEKPPQVIRNHRGEEVVTDANLTIQHVFTLFFWTINIASLITLATTTLEKSVGFWAAYLLPLCGLIVSMVPFLLLNGRLTKRPPDGNVLPHAARVLVLATRSGFRLTAADPSHQVLLHNDGSFPWTSVFVQEIRRVLRAGRVVLFFVVFYLCFNQTTTNIISQANQMQITGVSNDTLQSMDPIFYIILNPLIQNVIFPLLSRRGISMGPIARMSAAFLFLAVGTAYTAGVQKVIYSRGPCYTAPLACDAGIVATFDDATQYRPNEISAWIQIPFHFLCATSQIFGFVALNEFAYTEAPTNMKAVVKALEQLTAALGAVLGIALGPVSKDPWLVIVYAVLSAATAATGVALYATFRAYDDSWYTKDAVGSMEERSRAENASEIR